MATSGEEVFECGICGEEGECPEQCANCGIAICAGCEKRGTFTMWDVLEISLKCGKCGALLCDECAAFCHDCASNSEVYTVVCAQCREPNLADVECQRGHRYTWKTCGKHTVTDPVKCGDCRANRDYAEKHSLGC